MEANWIFALVRTTRGARKQQGITFLHNAGTPATTMGAHSSQVNP